jgi:hypothetical protein
MSLLCLRQSCRIGRLVDAAPGRHAPGASTAATHPDQRTAEEINHVLLSGVLVEEPEERRSPEGRPFTSLLVGFRAPDAQSGEGWPSACCEVEVPAETPRQGKSDLHLGATVVVAGRLGGGAGGVVATFLFAAEEPK